MSVRDHSPIRVREFGGRYARGGEDVVPPTHALSEKNNRYDNRTVKTREGSVLVTTIATVRRQITYKRTGEADRQIILDDDGNLWDSHDLGSPILTIPTMTDFSMITLFNRAYITPHDGFTGLAGYNLYVYQGSGTCREAAGPAPSSFALVCTTSGSAGSLDAGTYLFAVAYEYDTGYITPPGPVATFTSYTAPGSKSVVVSSIPVGPAGVVARHILCTKVITLTYSGNQNEYELFFAVGGRIGNNSATSATLSFFSADLVSSADYLIDQLTVIPAGVSLSTYEGRLVSVGENLNPSTARLSKSGDCESFDSTTGFVLVNPGDAGGGLRSSVEYKNQLNFHKDQRSYTTRDDGQNEPSDWVVISLDDAVGTGPFGVSRVLDSNGNTLDRYLLADRSGLLVFAGNFSQFVAVNEQSGRALTHNITDDWARINPVAFNKIQVLIDAVGKFIYINVPLDDATLPSHVFMGDYNDGMDPDNIAWSLWEFPVAPTSINLDTDFTTKKTILKYGSLTGNIYKLDKDATNDFNNAIESWYETYLIQADEDGGIGHFGLIRIRVKGSGGLQIFVASEDSTITQNLTGLAMTLNPGYELERLCNFQAGKASFKFLVSNIDEYYQIFRVAVFVKPLWKSRPS